MARSVQSNSKMKRKDFIRLSSFTAGAWLLADAIAVPRPPSGPAGEFTFSADSLLKISDTGKVTIFMAKQEMGQNVITALPLLIAEELEVDPKSVVVETLPYDPSRAGNYTTWASSSVSGSWMRLRKVGATAKTMLITAAANRWEVADEVCQARDGKVIHSMTKAELRYTDLLNDASDLTPPVNVVLKDVKDFKWVGQKAPKTNISAILTGKYRYTMDVQVPGI